MNKGVLTIAQGKQQYIDLAKNLAISLSIHNPGLKKALVTDSNDPELKKLYDIVIPIDKSIGIGFIQKLYIRDYTPFDETLFIDVDCLVVSDINFLWEPFNKCDVSVIGRKVFEGELFGFSLLDIQNRLGVKYVISFNGGVYYFKKNEKAKMIFDKSKDIVKNYDAYNIVKVRGEIADEPLMSLAMGLHNQEPIDDHGKGMYTPVGQNGHFKMDVLREYCDFNKNGKVVSPAIMHFGFGHTQAFHYRREKMKLKLVYYYRIPKIVASMLVNVVYNPPYIGYVFLYRLIKTIVKRTKFKVFPLMPMFRFE
ncbi:MAG: hypothetical protein NTX97_05965 [Bacteroidetes bacterium]|nr:hypothetical protein [Bacteroidota bacterium]